ncbi:MAG: DUF4198 domain-containing protein [Gimesia sp.]
MSPYRMTLMLLSMILTVPSVANAHFPWLLVKNDQQGSSQVHLYLSESAAPDKPEYLKSLTGIPVFQIMENSTPLELKTTKGKDSLIATPISHGNNPSAFVLSRTGRVMSRYGKDSLMKSYAKTYSMKGDWNKVDSSQQLALDVVARRDGKNLTLKVLWNGIPASTENTELTIKGPVFRDEITAGEVSRIVAKVNDKGEFTLPLPKEGTLSIRASYNEPAEGEHEGKKYNNIRHNSTLALQLSE